MDWVSFLVDPATLAAGLAAVATFATVLTIAAPAFSNDKLTSRLKQVANRREELRRKSRAALEGEAAKKSIRVRDTSMMKKFVDRLDLAKMLEDPGLQKKLIQAGLRGPKPISIFYFCRFSLPLVFGLAAIIYLWFINDHDLQMQMKIGAVVFAFAAGFYGPNLYLSNLIEKRRSSIMRAFPDSLDMILICV
ncbi:MAG TPA: type II secretion system F family protein, partial [Hyphomonadaceae bacterium]|nr:type II secretion system F family protein [Hyphomonadaceae bacterium]